MRTYIVEVKLKLTIQADNPGLATTAVADEFVRHLKDHNSALLKFGKVEAFSYPAEHSPP
ncbi:protein of unknown function [Pseudorhizobium banfieldiae]|uniref:Uncharacterized protein n=1 Tax=Pseudorhizobium banfieldiae TaxID=1125847 RepID=L0NDD3_9HYPH|nr:hypothetical protein [Pseudorhizobium banfieldiae]CAD6606070.1 hypothetical protein RNT25_01777 [arsenite-oxidising bacterium NT-25]CCF19123.1 protein of unknown function [Pseudorhizobium banfieldiae]